MKPFGLQSHPAQMHNTPVVGLAHICGAGHMYHTTISTACCIAWCVAIMHIHAFHSLMPAPLGQLHSTWNVSSHQSNQSDGCISRSNMKLSHCRGKGNSLGKSLAAAISFATHMCSSSEGIFTSCTSRWWTNIGLKVLAMLQSLPCNCVTGGQNSCSGSCTVPSMFILLQLAHPATQPCSLFPACQQLLGKHVSFVSLSLNLRGLHLHFTCLPCVLCLQFMCSCKFDGQLLQATNHA